MDINPIKLHGAWKAGFALDVHLVSSTYLGTNDYGHAQYDNIRSEVGELVYSLKYRYDDTKARPLAKAAADFLRSKKWLIDVVVPVPASGSGRARQTVVLLAKAVGGELGIPVCLDCVKKVKKTPKLKDVDVLKDRPKLLENAYKISAVDVDKKRILVLDDLYQSGATLSAVVESLKTQAKPESVYVLTLTKAGKRP